MLLISGSHLWLDHSLLWMKPLRHSFAPEKQANELEEIHKGRLDHECDYLWLAVSWDHVCPAAIFLSISSAGP